MSPPSDGPSVTHPLLAHHARPRAQLPSKWVAVVEVEGEGEGAN